MMMIPALNSQEIRKILKIHAKKSFREISARGRLPKLIKKFPAFYVINTDYYYEAGIHWLVIGFFKKYTIFIDSFGLSPVYYNFPLIVKRRGVPLVQNTQRLQSFKSSACGYYCIYFIYFLIRGHKLFDIVQRFSKTNRSLNDKLVFNFVKKLKK